MGLSLRDCNSVSGAGFHRDDQNDQSSRTTACEEQKGRKTAGLVMPVMLG